MPQNNTTPVTPAPWQLRGRGYIFLLDLPHEKIALQLSDLPWQKTNFLSTPMIMLVDYTESPVGPYYELLFIPGRIETPTGSYWHISKIYVSSETSAVSGRANWGIPKEVADFTFNYGDLGADVLVRTAGSVIAEFTIRHKSFALPVTTKLVPESMRRFYQRLNGSEYIFAPQAEGRVGLAEAEKLETRAPYFPAINKDNARIALFTDEFQMIFPVCESIRIL